MAPLPTLVLEAFGRLAPERAVLGAEAGNLYGVFNARAELMGWSYAGRSGGWLPGEESVSGALRNRRARRPLFWGMNDAALTAGRGADPLGWVQVGLQEAGAEPAVVLPALIQGFADALRRLGAVELSGLQVAAWDLAPRTRAIDSWGLADLVGAEDWFPRARPAQEAQGHIAFDRGLLGASDAAELVARLRRWQPPFAFGPGVALPEPHRIRVPPVHPSEAPLVPAAQGLAVRLPEWTG